MPTYLIQVFGIVGGLGLFLYGMQLMGDGLQKAAGDRLRKLLEILTSKPPFAIAVGALVTMLVQSSSATIVMVVGFVNAGLLSLTQAITVIMGANIGTTVTAFMVSLKLTDLALPAIAAGFCMAYMSKRRSTKHLGQTILGFGLLFLGLKIMGDALYPLRYNEYFHSVILRFSQYPVLGILVGAGFTALVQSSSATSGLVVTLASAELLDLNASLALILGSNIGTCITALLAAIGTQLTAKRAALAHLLMKTAGVIVFLLIFHPFVSLVASTHPELGRQVANGHIIFNVGTVLVLLPFLHSFVRLVERLTPGEVSTERLGAMYLDENLLATPSIALGQASRELVRMGNLALEMLDDTYQAFESNKSDRLPAAAHKEKTINALEEDIVTYLVKISQKSLSREQSAWLTALMNISNDIERIGDHAENIAELADYRIEHRLPISSEANEELAVMFSRVRSLVQTAMVMLESGELGPADELWAGENEVDQLEKNLRRHHINRLNSGICFPASGVVFLDLISNLERVADHASNIADSLVTAAEARKIG